ncbi:hypothetical protein F8271_20295 [Micromonospora sp. ALFpr18c]|uniref:hypothetical protein n=1 Tax=unclassified Micromonospora TaxID=2617518 RepID=UPI00124AE73F|nr:hypothetical protein [Micromonospora sp. ALFpr18c]KAB1936998.1 hypothetical protein F8271_20295 [Micromonospora sp. ALFpr18c]
MAPDPLRLPWVIVLALALIAIIAVRGVPELVISAAVLGVASGVAVGDGIATITMRTAPQHRAETVSTFFAILFAMLGVPAVGVGLLIQTNGLRPAGEIFSVVVAVLALGVLLSLSRGGSGRSEARPAS